ncbi:hypothetical protein ACQKL6_10460 [Peribacillus sp. NPDC097197]|uniref:hypothetical protein n=1 Tax=Peribacillus sp. NPDC097197 TaxID=3390615 RepID=UPI003D066835
MNLYDPFNSHINYFDSQFYLNPFNPYVDNGFPVESNQFDYLNFEERQPPPPRPPQGGGPPTVPPPSFIPQFPNVGFFGIEAGAMRGCLYKNTYIWLRNGRSFWLYPTYVGRNTVAGYRWRPNQKRWAYYGTDEDEIQSFQCY